MYISDEVFRKMTGSLTVCPCNEYGIIGKKEYMGKNSMKGAYLLEQTGTIENWAFAYCDKLGKMWIPNKNIIFDKTIFLDDDSLDEVIVYERLLNGYNIMEEEKHILAHELKLWYEGCEYDFSRVSTDAWYNDFDNKLYDYVVSDDSKGFSPFLAGGEEDYDDPLSDIENYKRSICIKKTGAILERMILKKNIISGISEKLIDYLKDNFLAAMEAVRTKKNGAYRYLEIYIEKAGVEKAKLNEALEIFGDNQYAECKGMLLEAGLVQEDKQDVWCGFVL